MSIGQYISFPGAGTISGTVTVNQGTSPWVVSGNKTNNNAAPSSTNIGSLPAIANAAAPSWTEGNQVGLSVDLTGALRTSATFSPSGTQDVNLKQVGGSTFSLGQQLAAASLPIVLTAAQLTILTPLSTIAVTQSTSPWVNNTSQINGVTPLMGNGVTGTGSQRVTIASDNTAFSVNATLQAGSAVIGHVIVDSGTVTISGTVGVTQSTSPWVCNTSQINGVTPLMGNGVTGTGSQRVTIASDNTAFSVNATLSAETTKVIGTINIAAAQTLATVTTVGTVTTVSTVTAVTAITNALPAGTNNIGKVVPTSATTASAPTAATVGVASASALASNVNRKGLILVNTSVNIIYLGFGSTAVVGSGVALSPYGSFEMNEFNFTTAQVNAIASAASSNLGIQEYT